MRRGAIVVPGRTKRFNKDGGEHGLDRKRMTRGRPGEFLAEAIECARYCDDIAAGQRSGSQEYGSQLDATLNQILEVALADGEDRSICLVREVEAVDKAGRHNQEARRLEFNAHPVGRHGASAGLDEENVVEVTMGVGANIPIRGTAALIERL